MPGRLWGEFRHSLDAKGRVFIPSRWKDELQPVVVVTKGLDSCLYVMTVERFQEHAERLGQMPLTQSAIREYSRVLFSGSAEETVDRNGRIGIPANLREYAGLEKEVVWVGVSDRAELWSPARWDPYRSDTEQRYEAIAEQINL